MDKELVEKVRERIRGSSQSVYREDFEAWVDVLAKQLIPLIVEEIKRELEKRFRLNGARVSCRRDPYESMMSIKEAWRKFWERYGV